MKKESLDVELTEHNKRRKLVIILKLIKVGLKDQTLSDFRIIRV